MINADAHSARLAERKGAAIQGVCQLILFLNFLTYTILINFSPLSFTVLHV